MPQRQIHLFCAHFVYKCDTALVDRTGRNVYCIDKLDWIALEWSGMDWIAVEWSGMDWIALVGQKAETGFTLKSNAKEKLTVEQSSKAERGVLMYSSTLSLTSALDLYGNSAV